MTPHLSFCRSVFSSVFSTVRVLGASRYPVEVIDAGKHDPMPTTNRRNHMTQIQTESDWSEFDSLAPAPVVSEAATTDLIAAAAPCQLVKNFATLTTRGDK